MLVVVVLLAGVFGGAIAPISWIGFRNEGPNRPSLRFSEMETTTAQGRTIHLLRLHVMTPNDRVGFTVWSPVIVVRVQVLGPDSKPMYDQERNGSLSGDIQPVHSDDITLKITELCSPCKYAGWEYVSYAQYSLYPYFEVLVFSAGLWLTALLLAVGNWLVAADRLRIKRGWLLLILVPVGLGFYAWYLWAFDNANYVGFAIGGLTSPLAVLGLLITIERRESAGRIAQTTDPILIAKRYAQESIRGKLRREGWRAETSEDGQFIDVTGVVMDSRLGTHSITVRMTKDGQVVSHVFQ